MDLEEQLRLKDSLARLGELTAGIAHEYRNGLATIPWLHLPACSTWVSSTRKLPSLCLGNRSETEELG